jgi:hypothetical protein
MREEQRSLRIRAGRYVDRLERRGGRWGIVERVLVDEWNQINPMQERLGGPEKYVFGKRDRTDAVFAIREGRVARSAIGDPEEIASRKV